MFVYHFVTKSIFCQIFEHLYLQFTNDAWYFDLKQFLLHGVRNLILAQLGDQIP